MGRPLELEEFMILGRKERRRGEGKKGKERKKKFKKGRNNDKMKK